MPKTQLTHAYFVSPPQSSSRHVLWFGLVPCYAMTGISGSMEYRRHHTNANHSPVANGNVMDTAVERASSTPHSPRLPAKHLPGLLRALCANE